MKAGTRRNVAAMGVLAAGLAALAYLILEPGLTPYLAVDELAARRGQLVGKAVRLAGRLAGTIRTADDGASDFDVENRGASVPVSLAGSLPANLEQGQPILLDGRLGADGVFHAHRLLTQCSSRYSSKLEEH